ncbi:MAG: radical SAM protein [Spirochaetes bacterium]|nr:radical SAM protein [Spirochaetota bacterium]
MKILILNPPRVDGYPVVREERYEHKDLGAVYLPLNLLYTAGVLKKDDHDITFIDANGFDISFETLKEQLRPVKPDVVISRCGFDTQDEDLAVLKYIKKRYGSILILRNKIISDVAWLKKDFLNKYSFIDIFVNFEMDIIIKDVIDHLSRKKDKFKNGLEKVKGISFLKGKKCITTPPVNILKMDIDNWPLPAYELLPNLKPYHTGVLDSPFALVVTSRGCPFSCSFCAYARMGYRVRKPEKVMEELKWLKEEFKLKSFLFFDDLLGLKRDHFINLLKMMIKEKLGLKWAGCTRANLLDDEMLKLMKESGCEEMAIGIESGSEKVLKMTGKGVTLDDIRRAAGLLHKNRILFYGLAIIGLPGETSQTIMETIRFIKEIDPFYSQFCFATPFPNTDIYTYYKKNGLLQSEDWKKYSPLSPVPVVRTKGLSTDDLIGLKSYVYRKLIFRPWYLLRKIRIFDWKWNIQGFIKILSRIKALLKKTMIR